MKCCICGKEIEGYGNNPEPIKSKGVCCDSCNEKFVIPSRLFALGRAAVLLTENEMQYITPKNGTFTLEELQEMVGGFIEFAPSTNEDLRVIVNEEGLIKKLYKNKIATQFLRKTYYGNVVICPKELLE